MFYGWPIVSGFYYASLDWSGFSKSKEIRGHREFRRCGPGPVLLERLPEQLRVHAGCCQYMSWSASSSRSCSTAKDLRFAVGYRTLFFLPVVTTAAMSASS
jgi:multiple sugar transport system permease protein